MSIGNEWRTPASVFEYWDNRYHFALDAAANSENALCEKYCSVAGKNGLKTPWSEFLEPGQYAWLNPPFSSPLNWVRKAIKEQAQGFGTVVCLNADLTTKAVRLCINQAQEVHFTVSDWDNENYYSGRVSFNRPDGTSAGQNRTGQAFFVFYPFAMSQGIRTFYLPITQLQPEKVSGVYQQVEHDKQ